jgi:nucleotide-binding universal stress UspA family protein
VRARSAHELFRDAYFAAFSRGSFLAEAHVMRPIIVAAVDFSDVTQTVLDLAAREVKLRPGAELHLLHVIPPPVVAPAGALMPNLASDMTGALDRARQELQRVGRAAGLQGLDCVGHVRVGDAADEIKSLADELDAELIVVGASNKGLALRALLGSTSRALLNKSPCSVLIARPPPAPPIEPRRADQDDDIHKRHHPRAHTYHHEESPAAHIAAPGSTTFRF